MCTGGLHLLLTLWFMYSVRAYNSLPDPSFFPNTIGIGYPAVKLWLYYPYPGLFLMAVSLVSLITLFPMSLFRVWTVDKISAPVCWIQISGPSIVLYTLTLLAQPPSYAVESNLDPEQFGASEILLAMHAYNGCTLCAWSLVERFGALQTLEHDCEQTIFSGACSICVPMPFTRERDPSISRCSRCLFYNNSRISHQEISVLLLDGVSGWRDNRLFCLQHKILPEASYVDAFPSGGS